VRYFLLIPALVLFLSNIPFVHKMDMKEIVAAMKKSGCCKKEADTKSACDMAEKTVSQKSSCHKPEKQPCDPDTKKCDMQDATCVCICCFQYAAPDQVAARLQFGLAIKNSDLAGFLQQHWKDPHLRAPWQPPDVS
jgi:hypothetical protein